MKLLNSIIFLKDKYDKLIDSFKRAKVNAKMTGKLLACSLALRYPFENHTVSLIAFSLGCEVVK
jgi:hypothetical protein